MRIRNILYFLLFFVLLIPFLTGCREDESVKYTVYFYADDVLLKQEVVESGKSATPPTEVPAKTGFDFVGWDADYRNITYDMPIHAIYQLKKYSITFNSMGGSDIEMAFYNYNQEIYPIFVPEKKGHEFLGWYRDLEDEEPFLGGETIPKMPAENISLYAKWRIKSYNVYYFTNGGPDLESKTLNYDQPIELPNIGRDHYIFEGWYLDSKFTQPATDVKVDDHDMILYAKWKPMNYTITLDVNGGDELEDNTLSFEAGYKFSLEDLPTPTNPNGEFIGWMYDNDIIDSSFNRYIYEDIKVIAKWKHVDSLYNEFNEFITEMDEWVANGKSYSLYTLQEITSGFEALKRRIEKTTLIDKENFYLEHRLPNSRHEIYHIEGDNVYLLKVSATVDKYYVDTDYLYKKENLPTLNDLSIANLFNKYMFYTKVGENHYKVNAEYTTDECDDLIALLGLTQFDPEFVSFNLNFEFKFDPSTKKYTI